MSIEKSVTRPDGLTVRVHRDLNGDVDSLGDRVGTVALAEGSGGSGYWSDKVMDDQALRDVVADPAVHFLPVYITDHSSVTYGLGRADAWDSWRAGAIYARRDALTEATGSDDPDAWDGLFARELDDITAVLNGAVYWFAVVDRDGEMLDSCGGFVGWSGEDDALAAGNAAADALVKDGAVISDFDHFMHRALAAFPGAHVETDADGQLVVHTGLMVDADDRIANGTEALGRPETGALVSGSTSDF